MLRIDLAAAAMSDISCVWSQKHLTLAAKVSLSVLQSVNLSIYGSETWTLLQADAKRLEAFHTRCQQRIQGLLWHNFVSNEGVRTRTGLAQLNETIQKRCVSLCGHIAHLGRKVLVNQALQIAVDVLNGVPTWRWRRNWTRNTWIQQISVDTGKGSRIASAATVDRGHTIGDTIHAEQAWLIMMKYNNSNKHNEKVGT